MGDIHNLMYPFDPYVAHFFTGSGLKDARYAKMYIGHPTAPATNHPTVQKFELDSVTFEFLGGMAEPWSNITIQVCQQVGTNGILLGELGNASLNPTQTQWPGETSFIDFHPLTNIVLESSSEYFVSVSVPYNSSIFAMLFTQSGTYVTLTDWRMGETTTHNPWAVWEYLKFAVSATLVQGTNSTSGSGTNSTGVAVSNVRLSAGMAGSNIVLSWPASTGASQLYSAPSFESGAWSPVSGQPVIINDRFVMTVPLSGTGAYFRLQGQ